MEFNYIKRFYPRAFEALCEWCFVVDYPSPDELHLRDLYDFFDERKLYVEIDTDGRRFCWVIREDATLSRFGIAHSRAEADADAFTAAFEVLEGIIGESSFGVACEEGLIEPKRESKE